MMETTTTRSSYIRQLLDEAMTGPGAGQVLPYSTPGFANPHPQKTELKQSQAEKYSNRLRSIQRTRFFRKAISASWKTPKATTPHLPPSMQH